MELDSPGSLFAESRKAHMRKYWSSHLPSLGLLALAVAWTFIYLVNDRFVGGVDGKWYGYATRGASSFAGALQAPTRSPSLMTIESRL
jgi:hypothetical protein